MNNLEVYIRESIFDKDAHGKVLAAYEEVLFKKFKKDVYLDIPMNAGGVDDDEEDQWDGMAYTRDGKIYVVPTNGIVKNGKKITLYIDRLNKKSPNYNIARVDGNVVISHCDKLTSLEGIFTPDCKITGTLSICHNKELKSLKGCPKSCDNFECLNNPELSIDEYINGPINVPGNYDWYVSKSFIKSKKWKVISIETREFEKEYQDKIEQFMYRPAPHWINVSVWN